MSWEYRYRYDKYWIGIVTGLLLPALFCAVYLENFHLWEVLSTFGDGSSTILQKLFLLSVFPNIAFIFVFYEVDLWKIAKGLLIGAMPYLILSAYFSI